MTRLILVRHGESNVTVNRIVGGPRSCNGLSDLGRLQAERLRERWTERPEFTADVLYASNYARAKETAAIIAPLLGNLPIIEEAGFGEHDPGPECDGLTYDEFAEKFPPAYEMWDSHDPFDPFQCLFPGGESVAAFQFRVGNAVRQAVEAHPDATIVVACHGGVIDCVMRQTLKAAAMGAFQLHPVNTSISEFVLVRRNRWRVERYNDHSHLYGLPRATNP